MIEADETMAFISALEERAPRARFASLLEGSELSRMFPAVGIPTADGLALIEMVNDPALRGGLDEGGRTVAAYLDELVQNREPIDRLLQSLRGTETELLRSAFEKTKEYLPESSALGNVRLVFLPIGYDFRTDEETVYIDPLAALQHGYDGIRKTLSHELHHIARYRLTGENLTLMRADARPHPTVRFEVFREWSTWLEAEGIADCVWNVTDTDIPALHQAVDQRRQQMAGYQTILGDALAQFRTGLAGSRAGGPALEILRTELLNAAHPVGAQMAAAILRELGRPTLVECVGRPDQFLGRYNEVAEARGLLEIDRTQLDWAGRL
jgi:Putative zinc dependent peptidase (DUF5700)